MQLSCGLLLILLTLGTNTPAMSAPSSEGPKGTFVTQDNGAYGVLMRRAFHNEHYRDWNSSPGSRRGSTPSLESSSSRRGSISSTESTEAQGPHGTAQSNLYYQRDIQVKSSVIKILREGQIDPRMHNLPLLRHWANDFRDKALHIESICPEDLRNSIGFKQRNNIQISDKDVDEVHDVSGPVMELLLELPIYYQELITIDGAAGSSEYRKKLADYREDVYSNQDEAKIPESFFDPRVFRKLPLVEQAIIKAHVSANTATLIEHMDLNLSPFDEPLLKAPRGHFRRLKLASSDLAKPIFPAYNHAWKDKIHGLFKPILQYYELSAADRQRHWSQVRARVASLSDALKTCLSRSLSDLYELLYKLINGASSIAETVLKAIRI
ncbi:MAG: hypothetical protein DHS80DRAFT_32668 [Piptocephalis tieghemiana]|nr:MAG: hypothetical protein DHS80DRAFT_32668 [Piptocephalis tieghemiana]